MRYIIKCECGWEKSYRNPVAAQWGGESHRPRCSFFQAALRSPSYEVAMVDFKKALERNRMADRTKKHDDPFNDEEWGPTGETMPASDTMPAASTENRPPWMKPFHVGPQTMGTMQLLHVTAEVTEFSDVVLLVEYRKKQFRIGLKLYAEDYKKLLA